MRRVAACVLGAFALFLSGQALAQDYRYHVFIDRDARPDTGCSQLVGADTVSGAEERLTANINGASVSSVTRASCAGGSFGSEQGIGGPHPVGLNNGAAGGDVIELAVGRDALGPGGVARLVLSAENGAGTGTDLLATASGGGPVIINLFRAAIPTLGVFGLLFLVGALLLVASRKLNLGLASLGALLLAGAVWAANFLSDGQVGDWVGQSALATDASGDATGTDPGVELLALFGAEENGRVHFRIDVEDVENQVPLAQAQTLSFSEDSGAQAITLVASDGDGDTLTYAIATHPARGTLSGFNAATGAVTYTPNANAEGADSFDFTASDGLATSVPATVGIMLVPVNDAPVAQDATFSVPENSANGTLVGTPVVATDVDTSAPNNTLSYAISAGNTAGAFTIDAGSGQIAVANGAALDFDTQPVFSLTVNVSDGGTPALGDSATVTIQLADVNEPPAFQGEPYAFTVAENSAAATVVGSVPALDPDATAPNNALTHAITTGNGAGVFAINAATGQITVANGSALNFEATTSFTLGVAVTDGGTPPGSDTSTVTISLSDVNEAPTVGNGSFTLPENSANGTAVGSVGISDPDLPAQSFVWTIAAGNTGGAFAIDAATGALTVATSAVLDFETIPTFTLSVQATDNGVPAQSGTAMVTVNLANVNEAPTFTGEPYATTLGQGAPNGTPVTTVTASDVDAGSVLSFAITGGNGSGSGAFAINPSSGIVSVADSAQLSGSYALAISVTDNGVPTPLSDASTVAIGIDEAPGASITPAAGTVVATSANVTASFSEPVTLTDAWFTLNCASSGNRFSTGELSGSGLDIVEHTPDLVYTIDPTVDLAAGEACTITIAAANVADNDAIDPPQNPVADLIVPFTVDAAPTVTTTSPADGDGNVATNATITVNFSELVNIASAAAFNLECNSMPQGFTVTSPASLPASTGTVTVTPAGNLPETSTCIFTVFSTQVADTDTIDLPDSMVADHVVGFTTTDPAPTVLSTLPIDGGSASASADLSIHFSEPVNFTDASFSLACPGAIAFTSSGSGTGMATLDPGANLPVGASCTVTVIAGNVGDVDAVDPPDTLVANHVFAFTPTNTPPTSTDDSATTSEDATLILAATDFGTFADADLDPFAGVRITTLESAGDLEFDSTGAGTWVDVVANQDIAAAQLGAGRLRFLPDPDAFGSPYATLSFQVSDGIDPSAASYVLTISVTAADDPPVALAITPPAFDEDVLGLVTLAYTDPEGDAATTCAISAPTNVTVTQACACAAGLCTVGVTGAPNYSGAASFAYTVTANAASSNSATASLAINPVNDPPLANGDSYDFIGNTELRVALAAGTTPNTPAAINPLANDADPVEGNAFTVGSITVGACTDNVAPLSCFDAGVGRVDMNADGSFSFVPAAGGSDASETFTYSIVDNGTPAAASSAPATVTLTRFNRVWYVRNNAAAGGDGSSAAPFDTLTEAQSASSANDTIFVYFGNGTSSGMAAGIALKNGQRLLGEHLGLSMPLAVNGGPNPTPLVAAVPGNRPLIDGTNAVSAADALPALVGGLSLSGSTDALDLTTAAAFAGGGSVAIRDNVVRGGGTTGFDINLAGTAAVNLALHDNTFNAGANAIDIDETGAGALTITAFDDNVVSGNVSGNGIAIDNAIFDATPGVPFNQVGGGITAVGASGNGVGAGGLLLDGVTGDLSFTDLDIHASAGAGLRSVSSGPFNAATGTGLRLLVPPGVAVIEAVGGPAVDITRATIDLQPTSIRSTGSTGLGFRLDTVAGTFAAGAGSVINTAASQAFVVANGTANIGYAGIIGSTTVQPVLISGNSAGTISLSGAVTGTGLGVALNNNTGATINFIGGLTLNTGTSTAFSAGGGGTVNVTGTTNTLATTTGTALSVANTTIGASGLTFRSISSNGGSNVGISLLNTGGLGGLTVTGTGVAGSGGIIASKTGADGNNAQGLGIFLDTTANVSLSWMQLNDFQNFAIRGFDVAGFTLANSVVNASGAAKNGTDAATDEGSIYFGSEIAPLRNGLTGVVNIGNCTIEDGFENNFKIANNSGSLSQLTMTGTTIRDTSSLSPGNNGFEIRVAGTASVTADITTSTFTGNRANGIQVSTTGDSTGIVDVEIGVAATPGSGGTFTNNNIGVNLAHGGSGTMNFDVHRGTFNSAPGLASPININLAANPLFPAGTGPMSGSITSNVISNGNSLTGPGIRVTSNGTNSNANNVLTILIGNNNISQVGNRGIEMIARDGNSDLNATVVNNTVQLTDPAALDGIRIDAGTAAADLVSVCAALSGNDSDTIAGFNGIRVRNRFAGTTFRLPSYGGAAQDGDGMHDAVIAHLAGLNGATPVITADHAIGNSGFTAGGVACPTP
jgi:hypothetical protein